jgi:histidinol-phosphate aminotransferase
MAAYDRGATTRRGFLGALGAGAAALGTRPVFALDRTFASQSPALAPDDVVHINYNESPYGPAPAALEAIRTPATALYSRYFPDDSYEELSKAIAAHHGVSREHVQVAAGSTEILKMCDDVFLGATPRLVVAEPAYEAVVQYATNSNAAAAKIPLTADFRHDLSRMAAAVTAETGLVYICNPNNPTGTIVWMDELRAFLDRIPRSVTVLVDEAYSDFVDDPRYESAMRYVRDGRNVIVAKTFSKAHGMAGMRVGYAVAPPAVIKKIKPVSVDYAITGIAARAALASLADTRHTARVVMLNAAERRRFVDEMKKAGYACATPQGNFVMADIRRPVGAVIAAFAKRGVLVGREFKAMPTFLRVTMGTEAEMNRFYEVYRQVVGKA